MNPYAYYLGSEDPMQVISSTPSRLETAVNALSPTRQEAPRAPGKWSPRQILVHLADTEIAFAFRLRQALAENQHVIQPFDQEAWMRVAPRYVVESALAAFTALRRWNLELIRSVAPEQLTKPLSHPERGTMTYQTLIETMAGHDLNHLAQLDLVVSQPQ